VAQRVTLVFADSPVEQSLVDRWMQSADVNGKRVEAGDPALATMLDDGDGDPLITPVGVSWLPPERSGVRRASVVDLLTLVNPRRPRRRLQERIVRRHPERARVVEGAPAHLSELRRRFAQATGRAADDGSFGAFVAR
jgi:glycerol-3-phosphate O-acyltransferase